MLRHLWSKLTDLLPFYVFGNPLVVGQVISVRLKIVQLPLIRLNLVSLGNPELLLLSL